MEISKNKSGSLGFRHFFFAGVFFPLAITTCVVVVLMKILISLNVENLPSSISLFLISHVVGIWISVYFSALIIKRSKYYLAEQSNKIVRSSFIFSFFFGITLGHLFLFEFYNQILSLCIPIFFALLFYHASDEYLSVHISNKNTQFQTLPQRVNWKKISYVLQGIIIIIISLNINIQEKPLYQGNLSGQDGYYRVTHLLGNSGIYFFREGQCLGGGEWKCSGSFYKEPVSGADANSFKVLNEVYAVDKNSAYYYLQSINAADPATFQVINQFFAKDKNRVYLGDQPINANPKDFKIISKISSSWLTKYFGVSEGKVILAVTSDKRIRNWNILQGRMPFDDKVHQIDIATFEVLTYEKPGQSVENIYAKDANYVYTVDVHECIYNESACNLTVVEGENPAIFPATSQ